MFAGRTLLVADESPYYQTVLSLTFADEGMTVIMAGDGRAALEKLERSLPDIIIASINMPGVSGYELCRTVKQDERFSHIPVMLLLGLHESFDQAEARRVGADDVVTKPFKSIRQLVGRVGSLLGGKGADDRAGGFSTLGLGPSEPVAADVNAPAVEDNSMTEPNVPVFVEAPLMEDHEIPQESPGPACVADLALQTADTQKLDRIDDAPEAEKPIEYAQADTKELPRVSQPPIDKSIAEESALPNEAQPLEAKLAIEPSSVSIANDSSPSELGETNPTVETEAELDTGSAWPPVSPASVESEEQPALRNLSEMNETSIPQTTPSATTAVFSDSLLELEAFDGAAPSAMPDDLVLDLDFETPQAPPDFSVTESLPEYAAPVAPVRVFDVEPEVEVPSWAAEESQEAAVIEAAVIIEQTEEVPSPALMATEKDQVAGLSAEAVDAIARRVVEHLSEKVVREIAWEVVPELAELLIKQKLAGEK